MTENNQNGNPLSENSLAHVFDILGLNISNFDLTEDVLVKAQLTKETAKKLLKFNTKNRPIKKRGVDSFIRTINTGRYMCGKMYTIVFDTQGILVNGQHRLTAISESEINELDHWFILNAPDDTRKNIDDVRKRSVSDNLNMEGLKGGRFWPAIYTGALRGQSLHIPNKTAWKKASCPYDQRSIPTTDDILDVYQHHKDAFDFVVDVFHNREKEQMSVPINPRNASVNGAFLRAFYHEDTQLLRDFVYLLFKPYLSEEDEAIFTVQQRTIVHVFRDQWAYDRRGDKGKKDSKLYLYALTEEAINKFCHPSPDSGARQNRFKPTSVELYPVADFDRRPLKEKEFVSPRKKPGVFRSERITKHSSVPLINTDYDQDHQDEEDVA